MMRKGYTIPPANQNISPPLGREPVIKLANEAPQASLVIMPSSIG